MSDNEGLPKGLYSSSVWFIQTPETELADGENLETNEIQAVRCMSCDSDDIEKGENFGDGAVQKYKYACRNCGERALIVHNRQGKKVLSRGNIEFQRVD